MYLFLDTETTGLYHYDKRSDDPMQPKIIELAALLTDEKGVEYGAFNVLIDHGVDIPAEATAIHGITAMDCKKFGFNNAHPIDWLMMLSIYAKTIIGHNLSFDLKMIRSIMGKERFEAESFSRIPTYCTMLKSTKLCNIPKANGNGMKWPKLTEAYRIICEKEPVNAHRAMGDVLMCKEIFFKLKEMEI